MSDPPGTRQSPILGALARGQFAWFVLLMTAWSVWLLFLPVDPDYTAGELLDHLMGWMDTGTLYPVLGEGPTLKVLNYPPLVLVLARGLTMLGLPALLAGRLVNGLGVALLVLTLSFWLRARGARGSVLLGSVGLLGASFPVIYGAGQFHVEIWAVLGTAAGFALADKGRGPRQLQLAGMALALGCFAKQTQVVPAAVCLLWIALHRREEARAAFLSFVVTGVVGASAVSLGAGPEAWRHMLGYTVGTFSLANFGWQLLSHAAPWLLFLLLAVWRGLSRKNRVPSDPAWWYWCIALLWSVSAARKGSGYPYFLDLHLATVVWVGPFVFGQGVERLGGWPRRILPWALAAQIVGADVGVATAAGLNLDRVRLMDAHLPDLCAQFEAPGVVLTEEAGLARACGRTPAVHPFIMTSLASQGLWDPDAFEEAVATGSFGAALVPFDPRLPARGAHADRWTAPVLGAFAQAPSVEAHASGWWVVRW